MTQQCTNTVCLHVERAGKMKCYEEMDTALLNYSGSRRNQINCVKYCCGMNKWCIIDTGSLTLCIPVRESACGVMTQSRSGDLKDTVSLI